MNCALVQCEYQICLDMSFDVSVAVSYLPEFVLSFDYRMFGCL